MYSPNRGHVQPLNRDGRGDNAGMVNPVKLEREQVPSDAGTIIIKQNSSLM